MNQNKTFFLQTINTLEDLLREYKLTYPVNFGSMVIKNLHIVACITLAICLVLSITNYSSKNEFYYIIIFGFIFGFIALYIVPLSIMDNLIEAYKKITRKPKKEKRDVLKMINNTKALLANYSDYPDVKKYLARYEKQIKSTTEYKQQLRKRFKLIVIGFYTFVVLFVVIYLLVKFHTI